jgi:hypothetical protein
MSTPRFRPNPWWLVLVSILCLVGMWLYMERVLVRYQISDAAATGRPRGNLSDLYPRWLGARELLLHGRDPYGAAVTREIQAGYYGRPLDPSNPSDPKDQQAFAYPVYVVFYLAPTVRLPFPVVQRAFFWLLVVLTIVLVPLCLRLLSWRLALREQILTVALLFGSLAIVQGLKLQQITLLVTALAVSAVVLLAADRAVAAGVLLGLATIKPQVVCVLLLWLLIWTFGNWKRRYRWAVSFVGTVAFLAAASELLLPHWISRFWQAMHEYLNYTDGVPLLHKLLPAPWSLLMELATAIGLLLVCWRNRRLAAADPGFAATTSLVLAGTLLLVPSYALYNQILLLPAILLLARQHRSLWQRSRVSRVLLLATGMLLAWQWLAAVGLAVLSFLLRPEVVEKAWAVPAWATPALPLAVTGLMLPLVAPLGFSASPRTFPS